MLIKDIKADDKISCLIYNVVPELQMIAKWRWAPAFSPPT